jgi:hypothetical protein
MSFLRKKPLVFFVLLCVLSAGSLFVAQKKALADVPDNGTDITDLVNNTNASKVSGGFVDAGNIKLSIGGKDYYFANIKLLSVGGAGAKDSIYDYQLVDSGGCNATIGISNTDAQGNPVNPKLFMPNQSAQYAQLKMQYRPLNGGCTDTNPATIDIYIDTTYANTYYEYVDATTIRAIFDNGIVFKPLGGSADPRLWIEDGTAACRDLMLLGANNESHKIYKLENNSGSGNDGPSSIDPGDYAILQTAFNSGCEIENVLPMADANDNTARNGSQWNAPTFTLGNTIVVNPNGTRSAPSYGGGVAGLENTCESGGGDFAWVFCGVVRATDSVLNFFNDVITDLLSIDKNKYESNGNLKAAWGNIRNIAYLILLPVMLVMVIGTALGLDQFNAYTVKKALPRMVVAVMFITLSWYVCQFLITFFNVVGAGVQGLITSPFNNGAANASTISLSNLLQIPGNDFAAGIISNLEGIGYVLGVIVFLVFFGFSLAVGAGIGLLILLLRQIFILGLILLSPLAILAWIFPGNDKLWKLWWNGFTKLLIMFPLIMGIVGMGRAFAWIIAGPGSSSGYAGLAAVLNRIMVLGAFFLPYAFIPFAFKAAGGIFSNLTGMVNDRGKGVFDRAKKRRGTKWDRWKSGNAFKGASEHSLRGRINRGIENTTGIGKAGLNPLHMRSRMQIANAESRLHHAEEMAEKDHLAQTFFQNDDLIMAGLHGRGTAADARAYLARRGQTGPELERNVARVIEMKRRMGTEAYGVAAMLKLPGTGTAFAGADGAGEWHQAIASVTKGDLNLAGTLIAKGRAGFRSSQRFDISESSFGDNINVQAAIATGTMTLRDASNRLYDSAYTNGGPSAVVSARTSAVENFSEIINQRLVRAEANYQGAMLNGTAAQQNATLRQLKSELASLASIHDALGSTKPAARDTLADRVMGRSSISGGATRQEMIEAWRSDPEFQQFRREYQNAANAAAAAAAGNQTPPGQQPPQQPITPGP